LTNYYAVADYLKTICPLGWPLAVLYQFKAASLFVIVFVVVAVVVVAAAAVGMHETK
jgi:hypothetical protein